MQITEQNLQRLRDGIAEYRELADQNARKRVSWQALINRVAETTSLYDEESDDQDEMRVANDAEALRQFVIGAFKRGKTIFRDVRPELLHAVAKFLQENKLGDFDSDPDAFSEHDIFLVSQIARAFEIDFSPERFDVLSAVASLAGVGKISPALAAMVYPHLTFFGELPLTHIYILLQDGPRDYLTRVTVLQTCLNFPLGDVPAKVKLDRMSIRDAFKHRSVGFILRVSDEVAVMFLRDNASSRLRQIELRLIEASHELAYRLYVLSNDLGASDVAKAKIERGLPKPLDLFDFGDLEFAVRGARERRANDEICHYVSPINEQDIADGFDIELIKMLNASKSIVDPVPYNGRLRTLFNYYRNSVGMNNISKTLVDAFNSGAVPDLTGHLELGARLDVAHSETGMTALHYIARLGWRQGLMTALGYKDRCNFTIRDAHLHLASHYAFVDGNDEVMARLLRIYQTKAGATLPLDIS